MLHDNFHGKRKKIINNSNYNNANLVSLWFRQITLYYLNLLKKGLERINLFFCHFERFFYVCHGNYHESCHKIQKNNHRKINKNCRSNISNYKFSYGVR